MDSNVVLTYKRKRFFSRTDQHHLHSHLTSEISESDTLAKPISGYGIVFLKMTNECKICCDIFEDQVEEKLVQCENCSTKYHGQNIVNAPENQKRLCSCCTKQQDSPVPDHAEKASRLEEKSRSDKSEFHTNELTEENIGEKGFQFHSSIQSDANLHLEEKSTETQAKPASEETNENQTRTLCSNLGTKRKWTLPLITFSRRSKRNRKIPMPITIAEHADTSSASEKPAATSSSMDPKNEKDNSLRNALISDEQKVVDQLHFPHKTVENAPSAVVQQPIQDSDKEISPLQEKATIDIDCNLPLDCGSDDNNIAGSSKAFHLSVDPTNKTKDKMPTLLNQNAEYSFLVRSVSDKGKDVAYSQLGNSSKYNYLQLFPETRTNNVFPQANNQQKKAAFMFPGERTSHLKPATMQPFPSHGLSLQPEQIMNKGQASWWPHAQVQPRESFEDIFHHNSYPSPSLSRHKTMLDNISTRARAVTVNRSNFPEMFEFIPTTWSGNELDSLWIGVRRHGRGNWDSILKDPRLHFLPWKTARDLAAKWEEEQFHLIYGKYANYPDFSANFMNQKNWQLQNPVLNNGSFFPYGNLSQGRMFNPYERNMFFPGECSSDAGLVKGNLPHWLRQAVSVAPPVEPTGTSQLQQQVPRGSKRKGRCFTNPPLVIGGCGNAETREDRVSKKEDLIVIPSDASSEETISDDHSLRH